MPHPEIHFQWSFDLQSSPEALWPLLSDTDRFNRDTGLPALDQSSSGGSRLTNGRRKLGLRKFGVGIEWEEQPFEWIIPRTFGVQRIYSKGPVAEMRVKVELDRLSEGGTHLVYDVWARPRNILGVAAIHVQIGLLSKRKFAAAIHEYDKIALAGDQPFYQIGDPQFTASGSDRLKVLEAQLKSDGANPEIVSRLTDLILNAEDEGLARIRPFELADHYGHNRLEVLEVFLRATRAGILDLRWDTICPHCRGSNDTSSSLSELESSSYCGACNIDFKVDFQEFVEITFKPNPAIRKIEVHQYCFGGPGLTPHIVAQQLLAADEIRSIEVHLETGRYRLRALELPGEARIQVQYEGDASATFTVSNDGWPETISDLGRNTTLVLENKTDLDQLLILETMGWTDRSASAAEVTSLQVFRDLFATEALRPGEHVSVGSLAIVFTDLRASTQLYRTIGDAPAFGRVMSHFDILRSAIAEEDGALVKTIGDAVMAVFRRPVNAVNAMLKAQERIAADMPPGEPLCVKAGIHYGRCIAVTLNDRLDYFGGTVNMASRLEGFSSGSNVIISESVKCDHEVEALLSEQSDHFDTECFEMKIKGFDDQNFQLWRVSRRSAENSTR